MSNQLQNLITFYPNWIKHILFDNSNNDKLNFETSNSLTHTTPYNLYIRFRLQITFHRFYYQLLETAGIT